MSEVIDVLIVGAGPIGLACGIEAKKAGLSHIIVDKGCLANSIHRYPLNMTFFSTSEKLEIGEVPFVSHLLKPTRTEALEYYRRVALHWNLSLKLYTEVKNIHSQRESYVVTTSNETYVAKSIIVATGFYDIPHWMNVVGEDLPHVSHYYKEPHPYFGLKVTIVGAANSAVDAALETFRKGAEVTMVIKGDKISDRVKYWVKPDIENRIKEGAIKAYFESEVIRIAQGELDIQTPSGITTIQNDFVLALTGYVPDFAFLDRIGIEKLGDKNLTPSYNPETMETSKENIYLAGVICGGMNTHTWFIENSRTHASLIIKHLGTKLSRKNSGI